MLVYQRVHISYIISQNILHLEYISNKTLAQFASSNSGCFLGASPQYMLVLIPANPVRIPIGIPFRFH